MTQQVVNTGIVAGDGTGSRGQVPWNAFNSNSLELYRNAFFFGLDTGVVNAPVITLANLLPGPAAAFSPNASTILRFVPGFVNTGPATLTFAGNPAVAILKSSGVALTGGELVGLTILEFTGAAWQIVGPTQASIGATLYPQTSAEIAAGVTPVNFQYPPYNVLRYGTNTTPGTTDMTAAFLNAIASANAFVVGESSGATVFAPGGLYQTSSQLVFPNSVSLKGDGDRTTTIRVGSTFTALTATVTSAAGTGGAIRIGVGSTFTFGVTLSDFTLELGSVSTVACIGIGSSDIQDCGMRNVTVNNFGGRGVQFIGTGGTFASVNGFMLENVQCFKAANAPAGEIAFDIQNGTYPWIINVGQTFGPATNPLTTGFSLINTVGTLNSCNTDAGALIAATNGVLVGAGSFANINIVNFTSNATTNAIHITGTGPVTVQGLYAPNGTNSIVDNGAGGSIAKTITSTLVPFYCRGAGNPAYFENNQFYGNQLIAGPGGANAAIKVDSPGNIGTGRYQIYVGDGTGGTTSGDSYETGINNNKHFGYVGFYVPGLNGTFQSNVGTYAGTGAPSNTFGNNGDLYFNAAGGALTTIYQKRAGTWAGIV
jgi:hypothetical protein